MSFSLFDRLKKGAEMSRPDETGVDLSRLKLKPASSPEDSQPRLPDMQVWLQRDLNLLKEAWAAFSQHPAPDTWQAVRNAAHNLHGASGAYGGGALTRLTESVQHLLQSQADTAANMALVNLHIQACQAWAFGNEEARTTLAFAVCDALEGQVNRWGGGPKPR